MDTSSIENNVSVSRSALSIEILQQFIITSAETEFHGSKMGIKGSKNLTCSNKNQ